MYRVIGIRADRAVPLCRCASGNRLLDTGHANRNVARRGTALSLSLSLSPSLSLALSLSYLPSHALSLSRLACPLSPPLIFRAAPSWSHGHRFPPYRQVGPTPGGAARLTSESPPPPTPPQGSPPRGDPRSPSSRTRRTNCIIRHRDIRPTGG